MSTYVTRRLQETHNNRGTDSDAKHPQGNLIHHHGRDAPLLFVLVDVVVHHRILDQSLDFFQDFLSQVEQGTAAEVVLVVTRPQRLERASQGKVRRDVEGLVVSQQMCIVRVVVALVWLVLAVTGMPSICAAHDFLAGGHFIKQLGGSSKVLPHVWMLVDARQLLHVDAKEVAKVTQHVFAKPWRHLDDVRVVVFQDEAGPYQAHGHFAHPGHVELGYQGDCVRGWRDGLCYHQHEHRHGQQDCDGQWDPFTCGQREHAVIYWAILFLEPEWPDSIFDNYSPKWRWIAVDIYRAASAR